MSLPVAPFANLPHTEWHNNKEKKRRIPIEDLLYSSSDSEFSENESGEESEQYDDYSESVDSGPYLNTDSSDQPQKFYLEPDERSSISYEDQLSLVADADDSPVTATHPRQRSQRWTLGRMTEGIKNILRYSETYRDFQMWRRKKAEERRHHLIKYFENKVIKFDEERTAALTQEAFAKRRSSRPITAITTTFHYLIYLFLKLYLCKIIYKILIFS